MNVAIIPVQVHTYTYISGLNTVAVKTLIVSRFSKYKWSSIIVYASSLLKIVKLNSIIRNLNNRLLEFSYIHITYTHPNNFSGVLNMYL